ncbi:MAG TPA: DUF1415 domain-containing protein [Polyangiaceae bacterium]|nr:DUF1415 domain-containing protein [Polyangiaceae bacterium]
MQAEDNDPLAATERWVERVVIGLNLCPFAKAVQARGQVRYRLSAATSPEALLGDLRDELLSLQSADPAIVDTSLLVHPHVLQDFHDYNDFLAEADAELGLLGLEGELQIASFHPDYCFADSEPDDPANYSNRSPFPLLHLLRETSVSRAVDAFPDASRIYERNIATLRALEPAALARLLRSSQKK